MDKRHYELLDLIKKRFIETHEYPSFQVEESGPDVSARQFYLKNLSDNLVRPMSKQHECEFSNGSGNELNDKMRALRSSSAMTFNILGNTECEIANPNKIFPSRKYGIQYEYQLPTLRSGFPANLDAFLTGSTGDVVACEMKMLEWLTGKPAKLKDKYLNPRNYIHPGSAPIFADIAHTLNTNELFTHYDFAQMFKHAIALYNACASGTLHTNKMILLNCIWEPPPYFDFSKDATLWIEESIAREHKGFQEFVSIIEPITNVFEKDCETEFSIWYMTSANLIDNLIHSDSEKKRLERYQ